MIILTARGAGFHTLSPLGTPLAPNLFLNSDANLLGTVLGTAELGWESQDSRARGDYGIHLTGTSFSQTGPLEAELAVSQITYTRTTHGGEVVIGRLSLSPPVTLDLRAVREGPGEITDWAGDLGPALAEAVKAQGILFEGGAGADVFDPATHILPIYGSVELNGRGGNDHLTGGRNDDTIRGGSGDDDLEGGGGRDSLNGGKGADVLSLNGFSTGSEARGGRGDDHLISSNGADLLVGNRGADRLDGGRGDDALRGGRGNDRLDGGEGDDRLSGGAGDDVLTGGWGADAFVFRADQAGHDLLTDFDPAEGDRLVVRGLETDDVTVSVQGDDLLLSWNDGTATLTLEGLADSGFEFF